MKHYYRRQDTLPESNHQTTCQRMHEMANICWSWLDAYTGRHTQPIHAQSGIMRSTRLACLQAGSGAPATQSELQFVVLPDCFGTTDATKYGVHLHWRIVVYSWLENDTQARLAAHLKANTDCTGVTWMRVAPTINERID